MLKDKSPTEEVTDGAKKMLTKTLLRTVKFVLIVLISILVFLALLVGSLRYIYNADTADKLYEEVNNAED